MPVPCRVASLCVFQMAAFLAPELDAQHLAYDEVRGQLTAGFRGERQGGWNRVVNVGDGVLLASQGNDWRELQSAVRSGVVWYAVTLRMQQPIMGYASVVPAAKPGQQVSELGFNSGLGTDQGLWTSNRGVVQTGIVATTTQTFLQRYDLDRALWSAWVGEGDGRTLLAADGTVRAEPRVHDSPLNTSTIGALYLTKGSAEVLEIHRLALARSAVEALTPVTPEHLPVLENAPPAAELAALPTTGIDAFANRAALPAGGNIAFFGDSLTWQGGHVERLRRALAEARPDLQVSLHQRGINGGKSTDLVSGVKDLYGSTQASFAEVLAADKPSAIAIQIGINDVWHGAKGNPPPVYEQALRAMLAAAAAAQVPVLLCTPTVIGERRAGSNPHDAGLDALAEVVRKLAMADHAGARVKLCDLRREFQAVLTTRNAADVEQGVLTYDGVHLSDDGNTLLAHAIGGGLTRLLGEVTAPPVPFALVPWPRSLTPANGTLQATARLVVDGGDAATLPVTTMLLDHVRALIGPDTAAGETRIAVHIDATMPAEHHRLEIADRILLTGANAEALARGAATVVQLLRHDDSGWWWPKLTLIDAPSCGYRGLLVDVARQPHPIAVLEQLVTLCWFYKIRYLQLHLTDDQAFTFPSTAFPKLATPGHCYTLDELRGLHRFAVARGVTIIPELDVPGHCGAAITAMPELFRASDKHHATIAFARPEVLAAIDTLLGELLEVFPTTPFVHVGGDECDLTHVHENPDFQTAFAREGVPDAQQLYRRFLCQLREKVHARGKRMLVWEGFGPEGGVAIPTDVTVMAFEMLYHTPDKLVAAGYPVINTSWRPLYVVNDRCWSEREIYGWHRGAFRHFVEGFPAYAGMQVPRDKITGAQMCAWEQSAERELPSLRRRVPAMAERLWHEDAGRPVDEFLARLQATDARLTALLTTTDLWHGFHRTHFPTAGHAGFVTRPRLEAPGKPWIWRTSFPDHHPEVDIELLQHGWHVAYVDCVDMLGCDAALDVYDQFYKSVRRDFGLAGKPALEAVSRGGLHAYRYAARHPERIACIYADTPVMSLSSWPLGWQGAQREVADALRHFGFADEAALRAYRGNPLDDAVLQPIAKAGMPLRHVISLDDQVVPAEHNTLQARRRLAELGSGMEVVTVAAGTAASHGHHFAVPAVFESARFVMRHTTVLPEAKEYFALRSGLANSRAKFASTKTGRVAFLGGSITFNPGWRDAVMRCLQQHFPDTRFDFVAAGIPSLGSVPHAFRLARDVLARGPVDLVFVEAAVNDHNYDTFANRAELALRGMEGVVRQLRTAQPSADVVLLHFVHDQHFAAYGNGTEPYTIAAHERVAAHYGCPSLRLSREVHERIAAGQFTWAGDFRDLHPSPYGQQVYGNSIARLLDAAWSGAPAPAADHVLPEPLDPKSYSRGRFGDLQSARLQNGFVLDPQWQPTDGKEARSGFVKVPALVATTPGAEFEFAFEGTGVGLLIASGPDTGVLEFRIDTGGWRRIDTVTPWSKSLHLPWALMLDDALLAGHHVVAVRLTAERPHSALRVIHLLEN